MDRLATINFTGASGNMYAFDVYPYDTNFKSIPAVYFVIRQYQSDEGGHSHDHIYVGETSNLTDRFDNHHKASWFTSNNANAICIYQEIDRQKRLDIEADLIDNYNPPCND